MEPYDTKVASLTYLTNPLYQQILKQQTKNTVANNKSDIKFYRKRITALTKDMLKGEIPDNSYIKLIYDTYVNGLIKYFKTQDTTDIIQKQYEDNAEVASAVEAVAANEGANEVGANEVDTDNAEVSGDETKEITINNMNNNLFRKCPGVATLDNFVIKQHNETNQTRIIPIILEVDLKEPSLKKKGVKDKVKKGKSNNKKNKLEDIPEDIDEDIIL